VDSAALECASASPGSSCSQIITLDGSLLEANANYLHRNLCYNNLPSDAGFSPVSDTEALGLCYTAASRMLYFYF
jgi:hypothetical protein